MAAYSLEEVCKKCGMQFGHHSAGGDNCPKKTAKGKTASGDPFDRKSSFLPKRKIPEFERLKFLIDLKIGKYGRDESASADYVQEKNRECLREAARVTCEIEKMVKKALDSLDSSVSNKNIEALRRSLGGEYAAPRKSTKEKPIEDCHITAFNSRCPRCHRKSMFVNRPGDIRCRFCD
jgi:hypothetical protein